jgi:hypothetical protein
MVHHVQRIVLVDVKHLQGRPGARPRAHILRGTGQVVACLVTLQETAGRRLPLLQREIVESLIGLALALP